MEDAEAKAFRILFGYLVSSVDATSVLSVALSRNLITERQRSECVSEPDPMVKSEKFIGHLKRAVNGNNINFHIFRQILYDTEQPAIAERLHGEWVKMTRAMMLPEDTASTAEQVVVPDALLKELADLRLSFGVFLLKYEDELLRNEDAQKQFIRTLQNLVHSTQFNESHGISVCYKTFIEQEVSLFNITYLEGICTYFPEDVCTATRALVDEYKHQYELFMTGTTVRQFRKLFPVSATPSKQSIEKFPIKLKLENYLGKNTLADLSKLVSLFGVSGDRLHICKVEDGCIAVIWLCSTSVLKEVETAIAEASSDSLQAMGVLQVFIGESECFRSNSAEAKKGKAHADGSDELTKHAKNEGFGERFPEMAETLAQFDKLKIQMEETMAEIQPPIKAHDSAATTATSEEAGAKWHAEIYSFKKKTQEKFEEQAQAIQDLEQVIQDSDKRQQQQTNELASVTLKVLKQLTETQAEMSRSITRIYEDSIDIKEAIEQFRTEQEGYRKILEELRKMNNEIPAIKYQLEKIQQGYQVSQETHLLIRLEPIQVQMIATQLKEELRKLNL